MEENKIKITLWQDKKRPIFGLPLSFTKYTLTNEKLVIDSGVLARKQEEVRLYRIVDFSVKQSFIQRIFKVGNITIFSSDNSQENFTLLEVKNPYKVKDLISDVVEKQRDSKNIISGEILK